MDKSKVVADGVGKHTPGPWTCAWMYLTAGVNDGTHPQWNPPAHIKTGQCAYCTNDEAPFVRAYTDEKGGSCHVHRFPSEDWHDIYAADGTRITGNYDYEEGGVCSSEADAKLISKAPELAEALWAVKQFRTEHIGIDSRPSWWTDDAAWYAFVELTGRAEKLLADLA